MAISRFNDDVNVIRSLPDVPTPPEYSASVLKAKFDEAAVKIKTYLNETLLPQLEQGAAAGATVRRLMFSCTEPGTYVFDTGVFPSFGGVYDIVLIGGGGGGSANTNPTLLTSTGGGAGAVTKLYGQQLTGTYTVTVGAAGQGGLNTGTGGGATELSLSGVVVCRAGGGGASSQTSKIGYGGGIGAGDGTYGDGGSDPGHGGDNEYGRGVRGASTAAAVSAASGYGAGGWAAFPPTGGAAFIYGYERR
ncbi:MAG: hypothetical protein J6330_04675 [Clostridia bacterium]|nr:hypothetical protein [Clostridia bacterium]